MTQPPDHTEPRRLALKWADGGPGPEDGRSGLTPARWLDTGRSVSILTRLVGFQAANGPSSRIAWQYPQGQVSLCMPHGQREPFSRHRGY